MMVISLESVPFLSDLHFAMYYIIESVDSISDPNAPYIYTLQKKGIPHKRYISKSSNLHQRVLRVSLHP